MESNHQVAERRASEWLTQRDSGVWSPADQAALDEWLDESPANAVAFIRLEAAWSRADRYKALGAGFTPRCVPTPQQLSGSPFFDESVASALRSRQADDESAFGKAPAARRLRRYSLRFVLAASIILAVTVGIVSYLHTSARTLATPVGGLASIPLQDGSRVTLNTDSKVRVAVTDVERRVQLERGEAFFEVAKDAKRPFVVDAGTRRVVAVGTQFSVRRDGENVRVVVTEGRVRIEDADSAATAEGVFTLDAGGVARSGGEGVLIQTQPLLDAREALSWRAGFVVFRDVDLAAAVAEFNRYNEKKIVIRDPAVAAIRLSGKFKATNFDAFVRLLEDGYPIEAVDREGAIVLTESAH